MPQANKVTPSSSQPEPHLKLRRASIDQAADGTEQAPAPVIIADNNDLTVAERTELPWRCVKCGDAMDTLRCMTLRGRIRYRMCRDHVVSTVAQMVAGLALGSLGVIAVGSKLIGDPVVAGLGILFCLLASVAGAALIFRSLPILILKSGTEGQFRLQRLHPEVIDDLRRSQRAE